MNDTLLHSVGSLASLPLVDSRFNFLPVEGLPFGGIGPSGCVLMFITEIPSTDYLYVPSLAGYHTGKFSFDMFTHLRSTLDNPSLFVLFFTGRRTLPNSSLLSTERLLWSRYPPYDVSYYTTDEG
jgi:aldehyde dehydrogenase (NAD+)